MASDFSSLQWLLLPALAMASLAGTPLAARAEDTLPHPTAEKLPRWRGFNLLYLFNAGTVRPPQETDFRQIHAFGFNFVRIPMDYRIWIANGDWTQINEDALKAVDQIVALGGKYGIHVCLNFHRAPGYTVAEPREARDLWSDPEAQRVCALHWAAFARRYKGIPNERLSFNLLNEPNHSVTPEAYAHVAGLLAEAIRKEDPDRLIIADGLQWGTLPCEALAPLRMAQATRGYAPFALTHFKAEWVSQPEREPEPQWPALVLNSFLFSPAKKQEYRGPLTLTGAFPAGTRLRLEVGTVSARARLVIRADGEAVYEKAFVSEAVAKEGEKVVFKPEYGIYVNVFNQAIAVTLPKAAATVTVGVEDGDWMTLTTMELQPPESQRAFPLALVADWGGKETTTRAAFNPARPDSPWDGPGCQDRDFLWKTRIAPWKPLEARPVGVMVGEWGCYNRTPYPVTLRWMEDCLANYQKAGWGWALWNFDGAFGIIDSKRPDVKYEDFEGRKLDRRMLELLQRY